ncbi:MAG: hypothetical protein AAF293_14550 [Pseudomonadota bacterium]
MDQVVPSGKIKPLFLLGGSGSDRYAAKAPRLNGWERDVAEAAEHLIVAGSAQLGEDRDDLTDSIVLFQNRPTLPNSPCPERRRHLL